MILKQSATGAQQEQADSDPQLQVIFRDDTLKISSDLSLCLNKYPFSLGNIFHIIIVIIINTSNTLMVF
jgi:hypothetical protein